ncbi:peptidyl-prolyl cis-trans isomerase CYP26-2, chloroplastic [Aristolochia californica]|uniref:peptidyl-prolyl cis-trans isomerase CYP26-2, chloroplastic n=1 Tax=Aristolochia californica TaxID=171875 RepID=UPI0035E08C2C
MRLRLLQTSTSSSPQLPQPLQQKQNHPTHHISPPPSTSLPRLRGSIKISRRDFAVRAPSSSLLLLWGTQAIDPFGFSLAQADDAPPLAANNAVLEEHLKTIDCSNRNTTKQAFFDVSIDGEPVGRITVGLYEANTPIGSARFSKLVSGAAGISYRRKEFVRIMPSYIQHGGVRSYGVDADLARKKGSELVVDNLISEWERTSSNCPGIKNVAGSLGLIIRDPSKPPPKVKLVARKGKLEIDQEEVGKDPNGTEFVISTKDAPELDNSTLVIGKVVEGMEVVERINKVKTVQENTSSPYFRVAKLIGDKRAVVAERGFNRPYSKIVITNCGLID